MCCFHFSVCQAMHLSGLCLVHVTIKKHNANLLRVTSTYSSHWIPSTSCQISNWMIPPLLNCSVLTLCWNVHMFSRGTIKVSSLIGWIGRAWSRASSLKGRSLFCRHWVRHKVCKDVIHTESSSLLPLVSWPSPAGNTSSVSWIYDGAFTKLTKPLA